MFNLDALSKLKSFNSEAHNQGPFPSAEIIARDTIKIDDPRSVKVSGESPVDFKELYRKAKGLLADFLPQMSDFDKKLTLRQWMHEKILSKINGLDLDKRNSLLDLISFLWEKTDAATFHANYKKQLSNLGRFLDSSAKKEIQNLYFLCKYRELFNISLGMILSEGELSSIVSLSIEEEMTYFKIWNETAAQYQSLLKEEIQLKSKECSKQAISIEKAKQQALGKDFDEKQKDKRTTKEVDRKLTQHSESNTYLFSLASTLESNLKTLTRGYKSITHLENALIKSCTALFETPNRIHWQSCRILLDQVEEMVYICETVERSVSTCDSKISDAHSLKPNRSLTPSAARQALLDQLKTKLSKDLKKLKKSDLSEVQLENLQKEAENIFEAHVTSIEAILNHHKNNKPAELMQFGRLYDAFMKPIIQKINKSNFDESLKFGGLLDQIQAKKTQETFDKHIKMHQTLFESEVKIERSVLGQICKSARSFFTLYGEQFDLLIKRLNPSLDRFQEFSEFDVLDQAWLQEELQVKEEDKKEDKEDSDIETEPVKAAIAAKPVEKIVHVQETPRLWKLPTEVFQLPLIVQDMNKACSAVIKTHSLPGCFDSNPRVNDLIHCEVENLALHHYSSLCYVEYLIHAIGQSKTKAVGLIYPQLVKHWHLTLESFFQIEHLKKWKEQTIHHSLVRLADSSNWKEKLSLDDYNLIEVLDRGSIWSRFPYSSFQLIKRGQAKLPLELKNIMDSDSFLSSVPSNRLNLLKDFIEAILKRQFQVSSFILRQLNPSDQVKNAQRGIDVLRSEKLTALLLDQIKSSTESIPATPDNPEESDTFIQEIILTLHASKSSLGSDLHMHIPKGCLEDALFHLTRVQYINRQAKILNADHLEFCFGDALMNIQWVFENVYKVLCFVREKRLFPHYHDFRNFNERIQRFDDSEETQKSRDDQAILSFNFGQILQYPHSLVKRDPMASLYVKSYKFAKETCGQEKESIPSKSKKKEFVFEKVNGFIPLGIMQLRLQVQDMQQDIYKFM